MNELYTASKDFMTGCFTRQDLLPLLYRLKTASDETHVPFSILVIDIDHFKSFNDKYGHPCGDELLKYFSSSLRLSLSVVDCYPFRYGGDEFVVVFPTLDNKQAMKWALQLENNIKARSYLWKGKLFKITFSGGIAGYPSDASEAEILLEKADMAMYSSKRAGRGKVAQYNKRKFLLVKKMLFLFTVAACVIFLVSRLNFASIGQYSEGALKDIKSVSLRIAGFFKRFIFPMKPQKTKASVVAGKNTPQPKKIYDRIYLKSGKVFEGNIISQDAENVVISFNLGEGSLITSFKKTDILKIEEAAEQ